MYRSSKKSKRRITDLTDREIIDLFAARSERAIEETSLKYGKYLYTISFNILRDARDAEECVNDTLSRLWDAIPKSEPEALRPFLGRIARNVALNRYERETAAKRGGGETATPIDELSECVSGEETDEIARMMIRDLLREFVASLPGEKKIIFLARYWYAYPISEIAKKTGKNENTVKTILSRTRTELGKLLKREGLY